MSAVRMCLKDRDSIWHATAGKGDSWFVPIRCGGDGMGINLPGNQERRVPSCSECRAAVRRGRAALSEAGLSPADQGSTE